MKLKHLATKPPVHTIVEIGNCYKVARIKPPAFTAIYKDGSLTDIVWQDAIPDNAKALIKKASAFVNSYLTMQPKQQYDY